MVDELNGALAASEDDVFLLGNLAALAIGGGIDLPCEHILEWLVANRPDNAGPAILKALRFQLEGERRQAMEVLDETGACEAKYNSVPANVLYTFLAMEMGSVPQARSRARKLLKQDLNINQDAIERLEMIAA